MPVTQSQHDHLGTCPCCNSQTARTRGIVIMNGESAASYLVKWTVGDPAHGMRWLVSLPDAAGRQVCIDVAYSFEHASFMVRDRGDYEWANDEVSDAGILLDRNEVVGTPLAKRVFAILDEIWSTDPYVRAFVALGQRRNHPRGHNPIPKNPWLDWRPPRGGVALIAVCLAASATILLVLGGNSWYTKWVCPWFLPIGIGLWLKHSWARWLTFAFFVFLVVALGMTIYQDGITVRRVFQAIIFGSALFSLWQWEVYPETSEGSDSTAET